MTLRGTTLPEIMSSWSDATQILKVLNDPIVLLAIVTLQEVSIYKQGVGEILAQVLTPRSAPEFQL